MKMKKTAFIISAIFILVVLAFSSLFIIAEADHDCHGEDCSVCKIIAIAESVVKGLSLIALAAASCAAFIFIAIESLNPTDRERFFTTPVSLRVKLTE